MQVIDAAVDGLQVIDAAVDDDYPYIYAEPGYFAEDYMAQEAA